MPKQSKIYRFFAKEWHNKWMEHITQLHPNFDRTQHDMRLFKICYTKEIKHEDAIRWFLTDTADIWETADRRFIYNARYGIVCENDIFFCMEWIYTHDVGDSIVTVFSQFIERDEHEQTRVEGFFCRMVPELRRPEKYPDLVDAETVYVESWMLWLFVISMHDFYTDFANYQTGVDLANVEYVFANDYLVKCVAKN